eukprot:Hpha_TRINITY_DN16078_c3_g1::TRINITY_DN16078_c3_g1_i2::g.117720::m.117720
MSAATAKPSILVSQASRVLTAMCGEERGLSGTVYDVSAKPDMSLEKFIHRWVRYTGVGDEVVLTALAYLDKVAVRGICLGEMTCHRMILSALVVATKWHCDQHNDMVYYAKVGGVTCKDLGSLERRMLRDLEFDAFCDASIIAQYRAAFTL